MQQSRRQTWMAMVVAASSLLAGLVTARCERPATMSFVPPVDQCCACLATKSTERGTRCSRGSIPDCIRDFEHLDIAAAGVNIRCLRDVCGLECQLFASQLPSKAVVDTCCQCLADGSEEGVDCYGGTTSDCSTEIEEGEINRLLQGAGACLSNSCKTACAPLFGSGDTPDAGETPDAAMGSQDGGMMTSSSGGSSSGQMTRQDGGPHLPWDGGCPLNFPCF